MPGGSGRERHKIRAGGSEAKRCKSPLPGCRGGGRSMSPARRAPGAAAPRTPCPLGRAGRGRSGSTPRRAGDQLWELSGPSVLPCPTLRGQPFTHGVGTRCGGDVPGQCRTWYGACPALCRRRDCPLGTQTDPEWKCLVVLYILEEFSFSNFVLNVVLFISTS